MPPCGNRRLVEVAAREARSLSATWSSDLPAANLRGRWRSCSVRRWRLESWCSVVLVVLWCRILVVRRGCLVSRAEKWLAGADRLAIDIRPTVASAATRPGPGCRLAVRFQPGLVRGGAGLAASSAGSWHGRRIAHS